MKPLRQVYIFMKNKSAYVLNLVKHDATNDVLGIRACKSTFFDLFT
jgi:hypothetical protein